MGQSIFLSRKWWYSRGVAQFIAVLVSLIARIRRYNWCHLQHTPTVLAPSTVVVQQVALRIQMLVFGGAQTNSHGGFTKCFTTQKWMATNLLSPGCRMAVLFEWIAKTRTSSSPKLVSLVERHGGNSSRQTDLLTTLCHLSSSFLPQCQSISTRPTTSLSSDSSICGGSQKSEEERRSKIVRIVIRALYVTSSLSKVDQNYATAWAGSKSRALRRRMGQQQHSPHRVWRSCHSHQVLLVLGIIASKMITSRIILLRFLLLQKWRKQEDAYLLLVRSILMY